MIIHSSTKRVGGKYVEVFVYVYDIIIALSNNDDVISVKTSRTQHFKLCVLGLLRYFLGLEIARSTTTIISIFQRKHTLELLENTGFLASKTLNICMEPSNVLCNS